MEYGPKKRARKNELKVFILEFSSVAVWQMRCRMPETNSTKLLFSVIKNYIAQQTHLSSMRAARTAFATIQLEPTTEMSKIMPAKAYKMVYDAQNGVCGGQCKSECISLHGEEETPHEILIRSHFTIWAEHLFCEYTNSQPPTSAKRNSRAACMQYILTHQPNSKITFIESVVRMFCDVLCAQIRVFNYIHICFAVFVLFHVYFRSCSHTYMQG